jgi:Transglycosylase
VPLSRIAPERQHTVVAAEDGRFFQHHGIDWKEADRLVDRDLEEGRLGRGGSTITQQLIKGAGMVTLFTIGAAGNINHLDVKSGDAQKGNGEAARIGTVFAGEVLKTYTRLAPVAGAKLQAASREVSLDPSRLETGDIERAQSLAKQLDASVTVKFLDTVFAFKALDTAARSGKPLQAEVQVISLGGQVAWVDYRVKSSPSLERPSSAPRRSR